jgi:hypothetical protein
MQRSALANILRTIADAIEKSGIDEFEDFDVEIKPKKMRSGLPDEHRATKKASMTSTEVENYLDQLTMAQTREAASEIIDKLNFTRKELEALARTRSVHVTKDDNVQRIKEKLVEAIVGSRLNSLAIRGK